MALGLIVVLFYAAHAGSWSRFIATAACGLLVAGAAGVSGGLLGFLFGIPRTRHLDRPPATPTVVTGTGPGPATERAATGTGTAAALTSYSANTNLEDVSDWLTKILVGIGLTQIGRIGEKARELTDFVGRAMGEPGGAPVAAAAILGFFLVSGFLLGYLWTRLYLPSALQQSELARVALAAAEDADAKATAANARVDEVMRQQMADAQALGLARRQMKPGAGEPPVPATELTAAIKAASKPIREHIFAEAQFMRSSTWADDKEAMERTIPVFEALVESDPNERLHAPRAQLAYAYKDKGGAGPQDLQRAAELLEKAIQIRGPVARAGFAFYELIRAFCRIKGDADFIAGKPSNADLQRRVWKDIRVAERESYARTVIAEEEVFSDWMKLNPPPVSTERGLDDDDDENDVEAE